MTRTRIKGIDSSLIYYQGQQHPALIIHQSRLALFLQLFVSVFFGSFPVFLFAVAGYSWLTSGNYILIGFGIWSITVIVMLGFLLLRLIIQFIASFIGSNNTRFRKPAIAILPNNILIAKILGYTKVSWDEVESIAIFTFRNNKKIGFRLSNKISFCRFFSDWDLSYPTLLFAIQPKILEKILQYYQRNPKARGTLGKLECLAQIERLTEFRPN